MLGKIIVRFMNDILEVCSLLAIIAGAAVCGYFAHKFDLNVIVGIIVGLVGSFLMVTMFCGMAFLAFEMNNNLIRIREALQDKP
ncbi:MAG: hypothetical protein GX803_07245 [Lentisphaerae bacterium]|jgi:preprotein translocase subunit SecF|nr:hypothetical protein [Lentisphaerota bacterium]